MVGEKSSHLHNRPPDVEEEEEEEEKEGVMSSPGDLSTSLRKSLPAFEWNPGIKRCLRRYKCHRLTAGRVAVHANL